MMKAFLAGLFAAEGRLLHRLDIILGDDQYLLQINREFLQHDDYTDIITFDLSEGKPITAEIYISITRVRENAASFGVPFQHELRRVLFHGALHLCGYLDKSSTDREQMRRKEEEYLAKYQQSVPRET